MTVAGLIWITAWTAPAGAGSDTGEDLRLALERVMPAVVKVYGVRIGRRPAYGSGVVVSQDGLIVTALSLLLEADPVTVVTADGKEYAAQVVGRDPRRQLALLKTEPPPGADPNETIQMNHLVPDQSQHLRPGDWVIAAGNPFKVAQGIEPVSIAVGVFSSRVRSIARLEREDYEFTGEVLLIDTVTSTPGTAGGAVVDLDGRWVGLVGNTVISKMTNTFMNHAIPVEEIRDFLDEARQGKLPEISLRPEKKAPGHHGIQVFEKNYRRNQVYVERVKRDSPAGKAGVKKDDRIVSVNGKLMPTPRALNRALAALSAGDSASLVVERNSVLKTVRFVLEEEIDK
jgi:serine protease Do